MLSKDEEGKLVSWFDRQKKIILDKCGYDVGKCEIDLNKSLQDNKIVLDEVLKKGILEAEKKKAVVAEVVQKPKKKPKTTTADEEDDDKEMLERAEQIRIARQEADKLLEEMASKIMQNGGSPLLDKAQQIYEYFKLQNLGCEHITLLSQFSLLGMGFKILVEGSAGIGKSKASVEQIMRIKDKIDGSRIKILSGHITPFQMYEILYNYRDNKCLIVSDEGFCLTNPEIMEMLKDATFRGKVYWQSSKLPSGLPTEFDWSGNIIINTNKFNNRNEPNSQAFLDRLICFKIILTNEQIIRKMNSSRNFVINSPLENEMTDRIIAIRSGKISADLTKEDLDYVYTFVTNEVKYMLTQYSHVSFRTLQKCQLLYQAFKMYFGGVSQYTRQWFEDISKNIVKGTDTENFIIATLKNANGKIKTLELKDLVKEHYGCKDTQAYERIKLLKEEGLIDGTRETILKMAMVAAR